MITPKTPFAGKVLWAIDAFHEDAKTQLQAGKAVKLLFKENPVTLHPVSVLSLGRYNPESRSFPDKWSELATAAQKNLEKLLVSSKIPNLEKSHMVKQEGNGVTGAVETFLTYALEEGADMIVVSSHGRKGAKRLFLGSFAETLVLHSPLPVLVLNPKTEAREKLKHILFPTDFSDTSKEAYERVLKLARVLSCKVLLFHKLEMLHPDFGYPFVVPPVSKEIVKAFAKEYHGMGEAWVERGRKQNVEVKFYLNHTPGYTVDDILKVAKKHAASTLIAMASQSGPVKSVLLGSLTRQVLRNATCPVLVIHPHQESLATKMVGELKETAYAFSLQPILT